jgi:hypothetical protein
MSYAVIQKKLGSRTVLVLFVKRRGEGGAVDHAELLFV